MAWNRKLLIAKLKAVAAHLGISGVLVGIALALMLLRWFPAPLYGTDGGGTGLKLLLLVDLVLGPLLTFIVFNPAKARRLLAIDLGVIAVLQLAAYGAGLWSIHGVRVQAVAFYQGQFQSVTAQDFHDQDITPDSWAALGEQAPYLVTVRPPVSGEEQAGVMAFEMTAGLAPFQLQFLYSPFAAAASQHRDQGWTLAALQAKQPAVAEAAVRWASQHTAQPVDALRFYRVTGFYGSAVMVIDGEGRWRGGFAGDLPVLKPSSQ